LRSLIFEIFLLAASAAVVIACGDNDLDPIRNPTQVDAGGDGTPGSFTVFDQIPQFGMYVMMEPANYTPPPGVLMWSYGTEFVKKLTREQKRSIGSDLGARITYHAQCDEYTRLGHVFAVLLPVDQVPTKDDPRLEIARFVTPFSDYTRGPLATYVFPSADLSAFAQALADPRWDTWIGISGGSNPRDDDACMGRSQSADFRAIGFMYSLELVSTTPLSRASSVALSALYYVSARAVPVVGSFTYDASDTIAGRVLVAVTGHSSGSPGVEGMTTRDTVILNGAEIGAFETKVDCEPYAPYSPDGNPALFLNNTTTNPRNWCPGALAPAHNFAATLHRGSNSVNLNMMPSTVPSGSYYPTSITFCSP
jgi:peptide-N-glycosidase F-like protein